MKRLEGGMKERPILFNGENVRRILAGTKSQTRRVVNVKKHENPDDFVAEGFWNAWQSIRPKGDDPKNEFHHWQFGDWWTRENYQPGDRLWVRERHYLYTGLNMDLEKQNRKQESLPQAVRYYADDPVNEDNPQEASIWNPRSSRFMSRWASRILLEVTAVRVERLQDIPWRDTLKEGFVPCGENYGATKGGQEQCGLDFAASWDRLNSKRGYGWQKNPWVWVVEFRHVKEG